MTAISKSKPKVSVKADASDEALARIANDARKLALADAREVSFSRQDAADTANLTVEEIASSWASGSEKFTALEYATAQADQVRTLALFGFASSAVKKMEVSVINTKTDLAAVVASYVQVSHPDIDVRVSFLMPTGGMKDPNEPSATVVQREAASSNGSGSMSGIVEIVLIRRAIHRSLDVSAIEAAAMKAGVELSISGVSRTESDCVVDTYRVDCIRTHAALPSISKDATQAVAKRYAMSLASMLANSTRAESDENVSMTASGAYETAGVTVKAISGTVVKVSQDATSKRNTEIEVVLSHSIANAARQLNVPIVTRLRELVERELGLFVPNLGIITTARISEQGFPSATGESLTTLSVTFASQA